ncbi:hypothetical protein D1832_14975 [Dermacoccus abyssi]|uniref:Uncharacterized protein n=1 Tax=Dermacoccus abyssi TaxID=322596 RepID=A0A417YWG3_9MICO|nr:hypothetical protein D1832_14975 [Dermacoccus abyssi]
MPGAGRVSGFAGSYSYRESRIAMLVAARMNPSRMVFFERPNTRVEWRCRRMWWFFNDALRSSPG